MAQAAATLTPSSPIIGSHSGARRRQGDRRSARKGTRGLVIPLDWDGKRRTREQTMSDIISERSNGILRVELNRPAKKNAMTGAMYTRLAEIFNEAAEDQEVRVVVWHGAGDAFSSRQRRRRFPQESARAGRITPGPPDGCVRQFRKADRRGRARRGDRRRNHDADALRCRLCG